MTQRWLHTFTCTGRKKNTRLSMFAQQEDRSNDAECSQSLAGQSERRRCSNNQQNSHYLAYLVGTLGHGGGAGNNFKNRLNKAIKLNKVWKSPQYSTKTKHIPSQDYTRAAYFPPFCTAQNARRLLKVTLANCSPPYREL